MLSITLKQLELFISVAETKSFSKTADLLAFSQPAVSSNISLLEEILHTELLDRTNKKKIEITEDGLLFYEKAKEILSSCYTLQDMSANRQDSNIVSIGAHNIPARYMVTDVMNYYRKAHNSTKFLLREGSNADIVDLLNQKKIDLGIVSQPISNSKFKSLPIFNDSISLALPNTPRYQCLLMKKPTLEEVLLKETFIWDNSLNDVVSCYLEKLGYRKNDLNIIAEFNSEQLAKDSVIDGLGLAFLSKISLKCAIKSAEVLTYDIPEPPHRTIMVVYNQKTHLNNAGTAFMAFLNSGTFDFEKCYR